MYDEEKETRASSGARLLLSMRQEVPIAAGSAEPLQGDEMSLSNLELSGYVPDSLGDQCPQCSGYEYYSTKEIESVGELVRCECGVKYCTGCLALHDGNCVKCALEMLNEETRSV